MSSYKDGDAKKRQSHYIIRLLWNKTNGDGIMVKAQDTGGDL